MPKPSANFDPVRSLAPEFPDLHETTMYGSPALKLGKRLVACLAVHRSAEPGSLVVRTDFEQRAALLADDPATFYLTHHYEPHPVVLVRMSRLRQDQLRDLLAAARHCVLKHQKQGRSARGAAHLAIVLALAALIASAQIADSPPATVADIPVNYTEANVGTYTLPDPLKFNNGQRVTDAKTWRTKRRPEVRKLIEDNWFGRAPARPRDMTFEVVEKGTPAFGGKAVRRQVIIHFTKDRPNGPRMDLLIYLPANATKPVPVFLNMSFFANNLAVADPDVRAGRRWDRETRTQVPAAQPANPARRGFPVEQFLAHGIGVATFNKDDLAPDFTGSEGMGVKAVYLKPGQTRPADDEWGAIAAWAWGASRALDYFETDKDVDARRVAIHGVSRLGKTSLWAAAADERFAAVVASCSGEGGAAIARRNYGETLAHMAAPTRYPYQFAGNYAKFAKKVNEWPVDANMLLALIAPRPLLLQTGNTDKWSDPYGEFLAALAAEPVYQILGKKGLGTTRFPAPGEPILHDIAYYMHDGGHGTVPSDYDIYIRFLKTAWPDRIP